MRKPLLSLFSLLVVGCATSYTAKGMNTGYSSMQLNESSFRVNFDGDAQTSEERARDFALLRSAELASKANFRYFTILRDESQLEKRTRTEPSTVSTKTTSVTKDSVAGSKSEGSQSTTTVTPGNTISYDVPMISYTITCTNEKPAQFYYDAAIVSAEVRKKYKIAPPTDAK